MKNIDRNAVWLITGCSTGLGRALATYVLERGYRLVATARDPQSLADLVATAPDRAMAIGLDVTKTDELAAAVTAAEGRFGAVDVLVNNAGYGYAAAIEEGEDAGVRAMFETNVFGMWHAIQAVLPGMRERGRGFIVNISSIGGIVTFPAYGFYHMTKFAVEGLSATLAKEVAPFGIGVTVVEPGAFRTEFRGGSMQQSPVRLDAYAETAGKTRDRIVASHGQQENDPVLGAAAIVEAVEAENPPLHLLLGNDAIDQVRASLAAFGAEIDAWETVTRSTRTRLRSLTDADEAGKERRQ